MRTLVQSWREIWRDMNRRDMTWRTTSGRAVASAALNGLLRRWAGRFVARMASVFVLAVGLMAFAPAGSAAAQGVALQAPPAPELGGVAPGQAPLEITVAGGSFKPIPINIPRFSAADPALTSLAEQMTTVVAANLARSGLFTVTGGNASSGIDAPPAFPALRQSGVDAYLVAELGQEPDGRLAVRFRLWDVALGQQLEQLQLLADPTGWRRMAHKVADAAYSELTGEEPYFDSRIVFVEETGPKDARKKRLAIMDQDGAQLVYLTSSADLVLTPRFSPVEQAITFISYAKGEPQVYLLNLTTERQEALGNFPGMTFAPRFSPDGDRVVMSLTRSGDTDLYAMDLATRRMRQLTSTAGIETAPSFAPDGSAIVFESDRAGSQQLYVMDPDGSNQRRISFGDGRYATPVWSPKGDLIAFTKIVGGRFHIGVMRPDGSDERLLTSSFLDEGPTWAPNGRVLMFFREGRGSAGRPQLYTIDIFGRNLQRVNTPAGASDPAWSPLLGP
ncbi:MAG: Tol-Pal system beta propeller repeat protein TolB [Pseudomonadota bacterium]